MITFTQGDPNFPNDGMLSGEGTTPDPRLFTSAFVPTSNNRWSTRVNGIAVLINVSWKVGLVGLQVGFHRSGYQIEHIVKLHVDFCGGNFLVPSPEERLPPSSVWFVGLAVARWLAGR